MPEIIAPEQDLLTWSAPSRPHKPLDKQLFSVAIVIAILLSVILAFAGEIMLIIVIVSMLFAYYTWSAYVPDSTTYRITTWGVRAHGQFYRWEQLNRWWVEDNLIVIDAPLERFRRLYLVLDTKTTPAQLQELLQNYLVHDQPNPTPLDKLAGWLARTFPLTK